MLKGHLYTVISSHHQDKGINVLIKLNARHEIFEGHFPGQPVLPGVCMMQIVKETLSEALGQPLKLKQAANLKFLAPVDPRMAEEVKLKITYRPTEEGWYTTANLQVNGVVCFKMQADFSA